LIRNELKREIVIEAPQDVVWSTVTEPDQIAMWFSDAAEFELRPDGTGSMTWRPGGRASSDLDETLVTPVRILEIDPPRYFAFRWTHPADEDPTPENSLLVEFTLTPEDDATRLTVVESGFEKIKRETAASEADGHANGWPGHLERLRDHVQERLAAR
jgi:uncharacterized protein YndB with AHSA1/START domain